MKKIIIMLAILLAFIGAEAQTISGDPPHTIDRAMPVWARDRVNINFDTIYHRSGDSTWTSIDVSYIDFDLTDGYAHEEGRLHWDDDDKTLNLDLEGGTGVALQIGQEVHLRATNKTGVQIDDGSVVYVDSAQGNRPTMQLVSDTSITAILTLGVVTQDIANNATGYVTLIGLVRGYDTRSFDPGDVLWADAERGVLTNVRPDAPKTAVSLGISLNSIEDGIIAVRPTVVQRLAWLSDVSARGTQSTNDMLVWNDSMWIARDSMAVGAMYYTDTYWDDLKAPFSSTRRGALSKPDFDYDNVGLLFPQNDTSEIVYAIMQFSHSRKTGTDISPHIHWLQQNSNDVIWRMAYVWFDNGEAVPTTWIHLTEDVDIFTYTSGTLLQITDFAMIDGSGITGVSSILLVKVWRDDNVDGGAGSGDALAYEFDVHYEKDQPASANEYSK